MNPLLKEAYNPETFKKQAYALIDILAEHLQQFESDTSKPVLDWMEPDDQFEYWQQDLKENLGGSPDELFQKALNKTIHLNHPNYMGHQISPPIPISAVAGLFGDFMNNGMGVYEMGAPATALERLIIKQFGKGLGFSEEVDGFLTSGGTLANLTALLCARGVKAETPVWTESHQKPLALMVSEEAHYCVDRAARIMGWGEMGIIKIPSNEAFQMRTDLLPQYHEEAKEKGIQVIAVVGSACTTSTGSFDNLNAIADFCETHNLWFHVDGAHGAPTAFSSKYKHLVQGINRADSVAMDFHKMLATPSVTTALFFKHSKDSYKTFRQRAQYLFSKATEEEWFNLAKRTFECTKLMLSMKVYSILRTYGMELFEAYVTQVNDLGVLLTELIEAHPKIELLTPAQCNIVCFRYTQKGLSDELLNQLNVAIRQQILEDGKFYIVQTTLNDKVWLRVTLTNSFTEQKHLEALLYEVVKIGDSITQLKHSHLQH